MTQEPVGSLGKANRSQTNPAPKSDHELVSYVAAYCEIGGEDTPHVASVDQLPMVQLQALNWQSCQLMATSIIRRRGRWLVT